MRRGVPAVAVVFVLAAGCGGTSSTSDDGTTTGTSAPSTPTVTTEPTTDTTSPEPPASTEEPAPTTWVMPDLVGQTLQDAQDAIQELTLNGIFFTSSTDATGKGRMQVIDTNWTVCSQNIQPGETITKDAEIEFAAVKLTEQCP